MSPSSLFRSHDLPERWFDRRQYRPRVGRGGDGRWFLLSGSVRFLRELPAPAPTRSPGSRHNVSGEKTREALLRTYEGWDLPRTAKIRSSIDALADGGACAVVAGQQPGFLTGPLYTIYKALSAIALAEEVERKWKRRCVPVFWVAGDDHDIEEIREARFPGPGGEEIVARLPHPAGRRPLSTLAVDGETLTVLDQLAGQLAQRRFAGETASLADLYRGRNLASGFAAILSELLGEHGLLVLDPERCRPLAAVVVERLLEDPAAAMECVIEGFRSVEERGLKPQVAPRLPLFLLRDGLRHHVTYSDRDAELKIDGGGPTLERRALEQLLATDPAAFSTGGLLRPLIQQLVFPESITVGGPSEVGYFAQLPPLCRWLGIAEPRIALRAQSTLIDGKAARCWEKLALNVEDLAAAQKPEDLVRLDGDFPVLDRARRLERETRELTERLPDDLRFLPDASLRRLARSSSKARSAAEGFAQRLDMELRRGREESFQTASTLWNHVFPGGDLQERRWNGFHYLSRYGRQWLEDLLNEFRRAPLSPHHRLILFAGDTT